MSSVRVQKVLSQNDTGDTTSHQAGILVPKGLASFFPMVDESSLNPRTGLDFEADGTFWSAVYIHYNNRVVASGTRDEYRITRIRGLLKRLGAVAGDTIELERSGSRSYRIVVAKQEPPPGALVIDMSRGWRTIRVWR